MISSPIIRNLLSDEKSLYKYFVESRPITVEDVKRHLMLAERENNIYIPDHHYRLGCEKAFEGIECLSDLFTVGLAGVADMFLEFREKVVYVKVEKFNEWQMLLPYIPPLILVAAKVWKEHPPRVISHTEYIAKFLVVNLRYTTLPSPYIRQLDELRGKDNGLYDLHIHLNGAIETDTAWQDFLQHPDEVYQELMEAAGKRMVKEQYLQLSPFITPATFRRLLQIARVLRMMLCERILCSKENDVSLKALLGKLTYAELQEMSSCHPMTYLIGNDCKPKYLEALLYILTLDYLDRNKADDYTATLFHYYLLILGQANKMLVQQPCCFGFEEFQKYSMNGYREFSEREYKRRFLQLAGNALENVRLLEGRFSPKDTLTQDEELIGKATSGWNELSKVKKYYGMNHPSELTLVSHFIKKPDIDADDFIRHKWLRHEVMHKANVLVQLKNSGTGYSKKVVGIDAAASEFDAPPEVFAPAYRYLRENGYDHFTYHAGEDFYHILSGLRAVYEAIEFLDLRRGDRIGHASATGVSAAIWSQNMGGQLLIRQGEYLDDLLFAYSLIEGSANPSLMGILPLIAKKINDLSFDVYGEHVPLRLLVDAWRCRFHDPEEELEKYTVELDNDLPIRYLLAYHHKSTRIRYDKIIEVKTFDLLEEKELTELQLLLLAYMCQHEIVIETLPTSNVVIGVHRDYKSYHLYNWMMWKEQGKLIPPIVVGTDDPGIFATNIYNEYANIYCQLVYEKKINPQNAVKYLEELQHNSRLYAF